MKAIYYTQYGTTDNLSLQELPRPIPAENEVLIKVKAASVNSWDWDLVKGWPLVARMGGMFKPRFNILGCDVAGQIEAVGSKVRQFRVGDAVFGDLSGGNWGTFAEYVCARENFLVLKPSEMSFEQAAAIPQAGVIALQGLQNIKAVERGFKVLMNGAGGGVGTFAIQIAKSMGAEVTAVDKSEKFELMRSAGADKLIDYTKEDFTKNGQQHDLILDVAASHSAFDYARALRPGGAYVAAGGIINKIFVNAILGFGFSWFGNKKITILAHKPNQQDLETMKELFADGRAVPVIDQVFPLSKTPEVIQMLGEGHVKGKVVIRMEE